MEREDRWEWIDVMLALMKNEKADSKLDKRMRFENDIC